MSSSSSSNRHTNPSSSNSRLSDVRQEFFQRYEMQSAFKYSESHSVIANFNHLANVIGWSDKNEAKYRKRFNELIGDVAARGLTTLETLQQICERYNLDNGAVPTTITKAKEVIKDQLHVNIYDYIEGSSLRFNSVKQLAHYSEKEKKIYPKDAAKENPELKVLLRFIARER